MSIRLMNVIPQSVIASVVPPSNPDPYFNNVDLLLHFDNGLVDSSLNNRTVTAVSGASTTGVDPLVGTGSLLLNSASVQYLTCNISTLNMSNTPFCIEFTINASNANGSHSGSGMSFMSASVNSTLRFYINRNASNLILGNGVTNPMNFTNPLVNNTTTSIAFNYDGTTYRLFVNGIIVQSTTSTFGNNNLNNIAIGYRTAAYNTLNGKMDEFRLTNGQARYTSNYTPTFPFPNY